MSDQSQGPGWWLASDGKWYPPQPEATAPAPTEPTAPTGPPPDPGYAPTQTDVPSVPPTGPVPPAWGAPPADQAPPTAVYSPDQYAPGQAPPGQYPPGQYPPGQVPPGGPPPRTTPPDGGGSKKGLLIGLAILVVLLIGAGTAFALTRSSDTATTATTLPIPSITTIKVPDLTSTTTKKEETTTTKKAPPATSKPGTSTTSSTAKSTTTTTATSDSTTPIGTVGDVKAYCAAFKAISDDDPLAGVDKSDNQAKQIAIGTYIAKHATDLTNLATNAPAAIQPDVTKFVTLLTSAVADPSVLDGDEFKTTATAVSTYNSSNC